RHRRSRLYDGRARQRPSLNHLAHRSGRMTQRKIPRVVRNETMRAAETGLSVLLPQIAGQVAVCRARHRRNIREVFAPCVGTLEAEAARELFPDCGLKAVVPGDATILGTLQSIRLESQIRHARTRIER